MELQRSRSASISLEFRSLQRPRRGSLFLRRNSLSIDDPDSGLKLKHPMKRMATTPMIGFRGLSPNGISNGHLSPGHRSKRTSSSSSHTSDDPELAFAAEELTMTNFFDFDENADDIYLAQPDEIVQKLRREEKMRRGLKKDATSATPFTPMNVETIGGAYVQDDSKVLSRVKEEKSSPTSSLAKTTKFSSQSNTPTVRDIITRDEKIQQLEREIEDLKLARWEAPPIPDTINRVLVGKSYCLEWYRSMEQKRALLDAAIDTVDGNCIMMVLLFIRKTLHCNILMKMLAKRPCAVSHYCSFLKQLHAWKELMSVYQTIGDYESLGYLKLRECEQISDADQRVKHLQTCQIMFKNTPVLQRDAHYVTEYLDLTKKQKQIEASASCGKARIQVGVLFQPLTTTLLYCCRAHYSVVETHICSPEALKKAFSVSERQYFQVCLVAFCLNRKWDLVESLLTTKGVFGIGKKKKSPIGFERVVRTLGHPTHKAPTEILTKYLKEVEDLETRLCLATYTQVFEVGIETLKLLRDRERLGNYINQIPVERQSEYRGKICAVMGNTQIKWKT